jgi:hypothetical protein
MTMIGLPMFAPRIDPASKSQLHQGHICGSNTARKRRPQTALLVHQPGKVKLAHFLSRGKAALSKGDPFASLLMAVSTATVKTGARRGNGVDHWLPGIARFEQTPENSASNFDMTPDLGLDKSQELQNCVPIAACAPGAEFSLD